MKFRQIIKQELGQHLAQEDFQRTTVKQSDFEVFNVKGDQIEESLVKGREAQWQFQFEIAVICDNDFLDSHKWGTGTLFSVLVRT